MQKDLGRIQHGDHHAMTIDPPGCKITGLQKLLMRFKRMIALPPTASPKEKRSIPAVIKNLC